MKSYLKWMPLLESRTFFAVLSCMLKTFQMNYKHKSKEFVWRRRPTVPPRPLSQLLSLPAGHQREGEQGGKGTGNWGEITQFKKIGERNLGQNPLCKNTSGHNPWTKSLVEKIHPDKIPLDNIGLLYILCINSLQLIYDNLCSMVFQKRDLSSRKSW